MGLGLKVTPEGNGAEVGQHIDDVCSVQGQLLLGSAKANGRPAQGYKVASEYRSRNRSREVHKDADTFQVQFGRSQNQ